MSGSGRPCVYIADDQQQVRDLLAERLGQRHKEVVVFATGRDLLERLKTSSANVELVVLDLDFGPGEKDGIQILKQIKKTQPRLPVIILTGKGSVEAAVEAVQHGADDFIEKDIYVEDKLELSMEKVERMLKVLRENAELRAENEALDRENLFYRTELGQRYRIVSVSPKIQAILEQIDQVSSIPRPVLIRGERGTGKELIAAALHYGGDRRDRPFVKLNCAALSEALLESELFGHEKGAFTGAVERRRGKFESAHGGTLFLDEIGNTSMEFQKNVLRVLEYQEFERIGGNEPIRVDVRVVAATNADLDEEITAGRFRADLYDRLRFSIIHLPPLRERSEDVRPLAEYFTEQICAEVPSISRRDFSSEALDVLDAYAWPGNVRELKFAVERALCVGDATEIQIADLPSELLAGRDVEGERGSFDEQTRSLESGLLQRALARSENNQKEAAKVLDLSYDRFRHLLRKHGLIANAHV